MVVACNFDHLDHTWDIPFPAAGTWVRYDALAGNLETVSVPGAVLTLTVPASSALMWFKEDGVTGVP